MLCVCVSMYLSTPFKFWLILMKFGISIMPLEAIQVYVFYFLKRTLCRPQFEFSYMAVLTAFFKWGI
jgi:hypothetical protein